MNSSVEAGVNAQLRLVDLISRADPSGTSVELAFQRVKRVGCGPAQAAKCVMGCTRAFYQGKVSCQRLLDVVVSPFLKLAHRVNQEANLLPSCPSAEFIRVRGFMGAYHNLWGDALVDLSGGTEEAQQTPSKRLVEKHAELKKAILDANIPEVIFVRW